MLFSKCASSLGSLVSGLWSSSSDSNSKLSSRPKNVFVPAGNVHKFSHSGTFSTTVKVKVSPYSLPKTVSSHTDHLFSPVSFLAGPTYSLFTLLYWTGCNFTFINLLYRSLCSQNPTKSRQCRMILHTEETQIKFLASASGTLISSLLATILDFFARCRGLKALSIGDNIFSDIESFETFLLAGEARCPQRTERRTSQQ